MENASKALIMAGSVLIALMILGALVLAFGNLTSYQETDTHTTRSAQIAEYNSQFETYNRDNVRGSDLYSLLNRVIDYNRRQSSSGTGVTDTGQDLQYASMEISFSFPSTNPITDLAADGRNNLLITKSSYTISEKTATATTNTFEVDVKGKITNLENAYGQDSLTNLTTNLTKIFVDSVSDAEEETIIVKNFNAASKRVKIQSFSDIDTKSDKGQLKGSTIRNDVYTYYEYVQFKRAYFDCKDIEYDSNTGRITKMTFEFNGKFN